MEFESLISEVLEFCERSGDENNGTQSWSENLMQIKSKFLSFQQILSVSDSNQHPPPSSLSLKNNLTKCVNIIHSIDDILKNSLSSSSSEKDENENHQIVEKKLNGLFDDLFTRILLIENNLSSTTATSAPPLTSSSSQNQRNNPIPPQHDRDPRAEQENHQHPIQMALDLLHQCQSISSESSSSPASLSSTVRLEIEQKFQLIEQLISSLNEDKEDILKHLKKCQETLRSSSSSQSSELLLVVTPSRRKSMIDDYHTRLLLIENTLQAYLSQAKATTPTSSHHSSPQHASIQLTPTSVSSNLPFLQRSQTSELQQQQHPTSTSISSSSVPITSQRKILILLPPSPSASFVWDEERLSHLTFLSEYYCQQSSSSTVAAEGSNSSKGKSFFPSFTQWDQVVDPCVITGISGIGKSILATKFCHLIHQQNRYQLIRWMEMDLLHIESSWRQFARDLLIDKTDVPLLELVSLIMSHIQQQPTLLIFDNADAFGSYSSILEILQTPIETSSASLPSPSLNYTPHVLITSRIDPRDYPSHLTLIPLSSFSQQFTMTYYRSLYPLASSSTSSSSSLLHNQDKYASSLFTAFTGHPLPITLSISFLKTQNQFFSSSSSPSPSLPSPPYLLDNFYNNYRKKKKELKSRYHFHLNNYPNTTIYVMRIWLMIQDFILESSSFSSPPCHNRTGGSGDGCSYAIPIFLRLCFYNQESIPLHVAFQYCEEQIPEFIFCLETLKSFDLISISSETLSSLHQFSSSPSSPLSFSFHELLSNSFLRITPLLQTSICHLISLSIHLQKHESDGRDDVDEYDDHHHRHPHSPSLPTVDLSSIYHHIGLLYLKTSSFWNEALYLLTKSLQIKERILFDHQGQLQDHHQEHEDEENEYFDDLQCEIAQLYHDIGMAYLALEQIDSARMKFQQSLDLNLKLFQTEICSEIFCTRFQLGILFLKQEKYREALELFDQLLKLRKQLTHSPYLSSLPSPSSTSPASPHFNHSLEVHSQNNFLLFMKKKNQNDDKREASSSSLASPILPVPVIFTPPLPSQEFLLQTLYFLYEHLGQQSFHSRHFLQAIQQYGECLIIKRNLLLSTPSPSSVVAPSLYPQSSSHQQGEEQKRKQHEEEQQGHSHDLQQILLVLSSIHSQYGEELKIQKDYRNCIKQFYESYNSLLACITASTSTGRGGSSESSLQSLSLSSLRLSSANQLIEIGKVRMIQKKYLKSLKCFSKATEIIRNIETATAATAAGGTTTGGGTEGKGKETLVTEKMKQQSLRTIQYLIYETQVKRFLLMIIYVFIGILLVGYQVLYREKSKWDGGGEEE
jgi:tetratricopeptide (TPR) repeat protein